MSEATEDFPAGQEKGVLMSKKCGGIRLNLPNIFQEGQSLSPSNPEQPNDQSRGSSRSSLFSSREVVPRMERSL